MPVVHASSAPVFTFTPPGGIELSVPHITVRGYAAPSRGSTETCMWLLTLAPQVRPWPGTVDREEIFFVLSGNAVVSLDGTEHKLSAADVLIVPPHVTFGIGNPHDEPLEMVAVLPVGGRGYVEGQEPFVPPWTR
jgi:mannose-6-phosphate isomerase-like protein (cupin superfamily)